MKEHKGVTHIPQYQYRRTKRTERTLEKFFSKIFCIIYRMERKIWPARRIRKKRQGTLVRGCLSFLFLEDSFVSLSHSFSAFPRSNLPSDDVPAGPVLCHRLEQLLILFWKRRNPCVNFFFLLFITPQLFAVRRSGHSDCMQSIRRLGR